MKPQNYNYINWREHKENLPKKLIAHLEKEKKPWDMYVFRSDVSSVLFEKKYLANLDFMIYLKKVSKRFFCTHSFSAGSLFVDGLSCKLLQGMANDFFDNRGEMDKCTIWPVKWSDLADRFLYDREVDCDKYHNYKSPLD